jgi:hypothetical protein
MSRYILSSAVVTSPGTYTYETIELDAAREWLRAGPWTSTIGYSETAAALEELTGVHVQADRRVIVMQPGHEALVFRLVLPPGAPRVPPGAKGSLGAAYIREHCELGILRRHRREPGVVALELDGCAARLVALANEIGGEP